MAIPKAKTIPLNDAKEILALNRDDITMDLMREFFACHIGENEPKYNTYDKITLPAGRFYNKEAIETTIGKFIFNITKIFL